MKHTSGPWRVVEESQRGDFKIEGGEEGRESFTVCTGGPRYWGSMPPAPKVYDEYTHDRLIANANLIASAPELLEALIELSEGIRLLSEELEMPLGKRYEKAIAVIAKAKGETE